MANAKLIYLKNTKVLNLNIFLFIWLSFINNVSLITKIIIYNNIY